VCFVGLHTSKEEGHIESESQKPLFGRHAFAEAWQVCQLAQSEFSRHLFGWYAHMLVFESQNLSVSLHAASLVQ